MSYEYLIAVRHLRSLRSARGVSFTAGVATVGVALGVAALAVVLSVMNGYGDIIWNRVVGVNAHVTVRKAYGEPLGDYQGLLEELRSLDGVEGAAGLIESDGFVVRRLPSGRIVKAGVMVRGTDEPGLTSTSDLAAHLRSGRIDLGPQDRSSAPAYGILLGQLLSERLGAGIGDEVHLGILPKQIAAGEMPLRRYLVTGVFKTGYHEFDAGLAFVSLAAARRDLGWGDLISGIRVRLANPFDADRAARQIRDRLRARHPSLFVSSWTYEAGNFYLLVRLQKWTFFLVLSLIIVVAGFNIISILTMSVVERRREIGILKAMGAEPARIGRIFTLEGAAIGLAGIALGHALGYGLCWLQQHYELIRISGEVYYVDVLPIEMRLSDFALISVSAMILCCLFTVVPARDAAALDPVEAIRYE